MEAPQTLLIMTTLPDEASARSLADSLVNERLAACVTMLAPCQSVFRWQGKVDHVTEVPLLIKSTTARYAQLETAIRTRHPYDLPEIVAIPLTAGLPDYLAWVSAETTILELPTC